MEKKMQLDESMKETKEVLNAIKSQKREATLIQIEPAYMQMEHSDINFGAHGFDHWK